MGSEKRDYIEKIKKSEEKYRTLINSIVDVIIELDSRGTFTFVNPRVFDLFGYQPEEMIGINAFNFVHPEDLPKIAKKMNDAIYSREIIEVIYRTRHKDGHYIVVQARGGMYNDNEKIKFIGVIRDYSELKEAEQKIKESQENYKELYKKLEQKVSETTIDFKESEKKFRHLFETSPFAIFLLKFIGIIIDCNSVAERLFNLKKDEMIGRNFLELAAFPSKAYTKIENAYKKLCRGEKLNPIEIQIHTEDDELIWVNVINTLVKLHNEIQIQVIVQDISERKLTEKALQPSEQESP